MEETAACWETCLQIPVRGILSGAHGGMHQEMVSCHCLHVCLARAATHFQPSVCVYVCTREPGFWNAELARDVSRGGDLSFPEAIWACLGVEAGDVHLYFPLVFCRYVCLGIISELFEWMRS